MGTNIFHKLVRVAWFFLLFALWGAPVQAQEQTATATFAGGCFWCMEPPFDKLAGVTQTTSGYSGGTKVNPTYEEVSAGDTGHVEALQIRYSPTKVSYEQLLNVFWRNVDPFAVNRQFCDKGEQYRSAIFYHNEAQRKAAEASKQAVEKRFGKKVATEVLPAKEFYKAEEYHQDYYQKNPLRYRYYRASCGRDKRLEAVWGKVSD